MSIKIMTLVWETGIGPATKRLVLLALADSANDEGVCWPSVLTLARKANASKRRTEEVLAELHVDGIVTRAQRFNDSNVYTINISALNKTDVAPREDCTPRENQHVPPANLAGPPARTSGVTVKEQPREEPTTADAVAPEQTPDLPEPGKPKTGRVPIDWAAPGLTRNQVATGLAQAQYERLGKMGNVPAWVKIIGKAIDHQYAPAAIDAALEHIAAHNWTLTEERLANTLRGGPQPSRRPAPVNGRPVPRTAGGMEIQR